MAVQAADTLQQHIHRAKIGDQQIGTKIKGLFECLGSDHDPPAKRAVFADCRLDRAVQKGAVEAAKRLWCSVGISNCSSHGLHKACVRRLAEAGCTHHEIKAITGHKTDAEVRRYMAKADQVRLAHSAFEKLQDTANNPKPANPL